jgi:protease stability complex PrcB-like protein
LTYRFTLLSLCVLVFSLITGCAINRSATAEGAPLARQVTESDHCGLTAPGLVYVSNAEELSQLSKLPSGKLALKQLRAIAFEREHLLLVSLGQKTTGGYGLTLQSSEIVDDVLELMVEVRRPAAGAMVTQALTTPCAVIAISPDDWEQLRVSGKGLEGFSRQR